VDADGAWGLWLPDLVGAVAGYWTWLALALGLLNLALLAALALLLRYLVRRALPVVAAFGTLGGLLGAGASGVGDAETRASDLEPPAPIHP
jgi:hypothetical protein